MALAFQAIFVGICSAQTWIICHKKPTPQVYERVDPIKLMTSLNYSKIFQLSA